MGYCSPERLAASVRGGGMTGAKGLRASMEMLLGAAVRPPLAGKRGGLGLGCATVDCRGNSTGDGPGDGKGDGAGDGTGDRVGDGIGVGTGDGAGVGTTAIGDGAGLGLTLVGDTPKLGRLCGGSKLGLGLGGRE